MEFTNASLEKVNDARKVIQEFTDEILKRTEAWLEVNWRNDYSLPDPAIVFHQEGWVVKVVDLDDVLNGTDGQPVRIVITHPEWQASPKTLAIPEDAIFTSPEA